MIDPAMCRPGRLDKLLYVDLPSPEERVEIMRTLTRKVPVGTIGSDDPFALTDVLMGVEVIAREKCEGYSGADLAALVREAGVVALRRALGALETMEEANSQVAEPIIRVGLNDFSTALTKVQPSVSTTQRRKYEALRHKFAGLPVRAGKEDSNKNLENVDS